MINLMIVEDNNVVREGLIKFFKYEEDFNVVATVDGNTAMTILKENSSIDIVMADWNLPDMDGLRLTTMVMTHFPLVKVVILTMHSKHDYKEKAIAAGARGYLLKDGEFEDLVIALRDIASGKLVFQSGTQCY